MCCLRPSPRTMLRCFEDVSWCARRRQQRRDLVPSAKTRRKHPQATILSKGRSTTALCSSMVIADRRAR